MPVRAFSQANEAQFYVTMSRARWAMHVFTDSKVSWRKFLISARAGPRVWQTRNRSDFKRTWVRLGERGRRDRLGARRGESLFSPKLRIVILLRVIQRRELEKNGREK